MAKITGKSKAGGTPAVRQTRGPGMNLGLKKPRFGKFSKEKPVSEAKSGPRTASGRTPSLPGDPELSYLGRTSFPSGKKRK
jgi:hypothetical protein